MPFNIVHVQNDSDNPVRTDPTGTTIQPVSAASLPLPTGAATETTLGNIKTKTDNIPSDPAKESGKLTTIDSTLTAIKSTDGIKKITDPLPAGTNNIGDVDVVSSALPTGAATETTLAAIKAKTDNIPADPAREGGHLAEIAATTESTGQDAPSAALQVGGVGTGAWVPDPAGTYTEPTAGKLAPVSVDASGNLVTRGQVFTDEESFREEFLGSALSDDWEETIGSGGAITVTSSECQISSGTTDGSETSIIHQGDYGPFSSTWRIKVSQRIANQEIFFGHWGDPLEGDVGKAVILLSGTNNTQVIARVQNADGSVTNETLTLPFGFTTADYHFYTIALGRRDVRFFVDYEPVALLATTVPGPYQGMNLGVCISNTGVPASSTTVYADYVLFENHNQVEVATAIGHPLSVLIIDEHKTVTGYLTTTSNAADQVILSYTVPSGRHAFLHSYRIGSGSTTINGNPVKICKNTPLTETVSPGSVEGNILLAFWLAQKSSQADNFAASPVHWGVSGDVLKVTVSPDGGTTTTWRANVTICLRR